MPYQDIQRYHLANHSHIFTRHDRQFDERQRDVKDFMRFVGHPQPRVLLAIIPDVHVDNHLDALLIADSAHAEHRPDIHEAEAADFHEMLDEVRARAHDHFLFHARGHYHVVRHQPVTSFDEIERHPALADTRLSRQRKADSVHIHHRTADGPLAAGPIAQELWQARHARG